MPGLTESERECVRRYVVLLHRGLGESLIEVRMFGSAARGEMWPATSPMHSDIDLLVVTRGEVPPAEKEHLLNETYPLFLECGRQISPHFYSERRLASPETDRLRAFLAEIADDIVVLWPAPPG